MKMLLVGNILRTAKTINRNKQMALVQQTKEGLYLKLIKHMKDEAMSSVIDNIALRI